MPRTIAATVPIILKDSAKPPQSAAQVSPRGGDFPGICRNLQINPLGAYEEQMGKQRIFWEPMGNLLCICGESTGAQIETNFGVPVTHVEQTRIFFRIGEVPTGN